AHRAGRDLANMSRQVLRMDTDRSPDRTPGRSYSGGVGRPMSERSAIMRFSRGVAAFGGLAAIGLLLAACGGPGSTQSTADSSTGNANAAATTTSSNVCPNGQVRFGVEPYDEGAKFEAAYQSLTSALSQNLNCPVHLFVTQNYTSEVEAMRAGKLDVAEFGPL